MKLAVVRSALPTMAAFSVWLGSVAQAADVQIVHPLVDVCSLLSSQTVAALLGSPAQVQSSDPTSQCAWITAVGHAAEVDTILIFVEWPGPTEVARLAQSATFGIPSRNARRVNDLPAAAVWLQPEKPLYSDRALVVLSGGMEMSIYVAIGQLGTANAESREYAAAVRVAKEALANLP